MDGSDVARPGNPERADPPLYLYHAPYIATVVELEKSFQRGKEEAVNIDVLVTSLRAVIGSDLKEVRQPGGLSKGTQEL